MHHIHRAGYIVILFVVLIAGGVAGYYVGFDHGWEGASKKNDWFANEFVNGRPDTNAEEDETPVTFHESSNLGYYGTITLTGYIDIKTRVCNPGDMCGETVEYASFVYTSGANEALRKFTGEFQGNTYIAGDRVGIGCYQKDLSRIFYENFADAGNKQGEIKGSDFTKLLASTKSKPVQLKINRDVYTSGSGAPDCYSHFRDFDVI